MMLPDFMQACVGLCFTRPVLHTASAEQEARQHALQTVEQHLQSASVPESKAFHLVIADDNMQYRYA